MGLLDILKQYSNPGAPPTGDVFGHFDLVAQQATPGALGSGIAAALRSDATPTFGQTIGSLFGQSNPQQKAGLLNEMMGNRGADPIMKRACLHSWRLGRKIVENAGATRAGSSFLAVLWVAIAGCAAPTTHVVTGTVRAPISPSQVKIYSHPPPVFEEVAMLDASSHSVFGTGGQKSIDTVITRLQNEAAKLGANGIILEGFRDSESGAIGAGGGSDSYSRNSAVGVGVGGSIGIYKKTGQGEAIFVPADPSGGVPNPQPANP